MCDNRERRIIAGLEDKANRLLVSPLNSVQASPDPVEIERSIRPNELEGKAHIVSGEVVPIAPLHPLSDREVNDAPIILPLKACREPGLIAIMESVEDEERLIDACSRGPERVW